MHPPYRLDFDVGCKFTKLYSEMSARLSPQINVIWVVTVPFPPAIGKNRFKPFHQCLADE